MPLDAAGFDANLEDAFLEASRALVGIAVRSVAQAATELTVAQYRVLVLLSDAGDHTVGDIAAALGVDYSNATRRCDRLQRQGLVSRERSTHDRRVVLISLTAAGRDVVDAVTEHRRAQIRQVYVEMSESARTSALRGMRAFSRAAVSLDEPRAPSL